VKPELMEILCCPVCKGDLVLAVTKTEGREIVSGSLACAKCRESYPIEDGIPDLLPPDERA
jgi:uncharacterized protein